MKIKAILFILAWLAVHSWASTNDYNDALQAERSRGAVYASFQVGQ